MAVFNTANIESQPLSTSVLKIPGPIPSVLCIKFSLGEPYLLSQKHLSKDTKLQVGVESVDSQVEGSSEEDVLKWFD